MISPLIQFAILKSNRYPGTYIILNIFYQNLFAQNMKILVSHYAFRLYLAYD